MRFWLKKLPVPVTNETNEVVTAQLWVVEWLSRHGEFSYDVTKQFEAFPSKDDAEHFAESLRCAFKLIRHTSNTAVNIRNNKS